MALGVWLCPYGFGRMALGVWFGRMILGVRLWAYGSGGIVWAYGLAYDFGRMML